MRFALVNPIWNFEGSIYFGCRDPHLPLEYGYSKALIERAGHEACIIDGQLEPTNEGDLKARVAAFKPDFTIVTSAPSYLFWRCAPPELKVPQTTLADLRDVGGTLVAVGPHASTTPRTTLLKLGVDVAVIGECEEILPQLADRDWEDVPAICYRAGDQVRINPGGPYACNMETLPALHWPAAYVSRHSHHHHRFEAAPAGPGAEMETSRGCPYHCTFCAKDNFRNDYRRRPLPVIFEELDALIGQGVDYVYFIDEIFLPNRDLLLGLAERNIRFGIQTRIDLWNHAMIDLLGNAGCVSIEAGVESITEAGRATLDKRCRMTTYDLAERLVYAKERVPFVQANLLEMQEDNPEDIERWRQYVIDRGVWANKPVPLFPYPGSPDYTKRWGAVTDDAWERAHDAYLDGFSAFSDIQEQRPERLVQLELTPHGR